MLRAQGPGPLEPVGLGAWTRRQSNPWASLLGALESRRPRPGGLGLPGRRPWCWPGLPAGLGTGRGPGPGGRRRGRTSWVLPALQGLPWCPAASPLHTHKQPQRRWKSPPRQPAASLPPASPTRPSHPDAKALHSSLGRNIGGFSSLCHLRTNIHPLTHNSNTPHTQQRPNRQAVAINRARQHPKHPDTHRACKPTMTASEPLWQNEQSSPEHLQADNADTSDTKALQTPGHTRVLRCFQVNSSAL